MSLESVKGLRRYCGKVQLVPVHYGTREECVFICFYLWLQWSKLVLVSSGWLILPGCGVVWWGNLNEVVYDSVHHDEAVILPALLQRFSTHILDPCRYRGVLPVSTSMRHFGHKSCRSALDHLKLLNVLLVMGVPDWEGIFKLWVDICFIYRPFLSEL